MAELSCSWCHTFNEIDRDRPTYCKECGHRADLARMRCDCSQCALCPSCHHRAAEGTFVADADFYGRHSAGQVMTCYCPCHKRLEEPKPDDVR